MDKQSRKAAPLVEEYSSMNLWAIPMDDPACLQQLLKVYPKGSRVTQRQLVSWGNIRAGLNPSLDSESLRNLLSSRWSWKTKGTGEAEMTSETAHHLVCGFAWSPNQKPTAEVIWIGIPRSVQSFLNDAIQKGHPKSLLTRVPDPALQKLVDNLLGSRLKEPGAGLDKLEEWETRRTASQVDESKIREAMDPIVNRILKGKETVLLEQLLNEYKFPDSHLVSDMRSGFALSGWVRNSKLFVPFLRPPRSTVAMQLALAPAKKALVERTLNVQLEGSVAEATWAETQAEASKGWITEDKDASVEKHLVAPRFGVDQGTKVRVIDDGKMAGINSTIGLPEKFRLHDVTFIAAFIVCALGDKRSKGAQVSGKTLDLKSAYKQYATRPEDRELMRIAAKDMSDGAIRLYKPCALPFGTTGSVSGFLRTAAAAWFLGTEAVKLCWETISMTTRCSHWTRTRRRRRHAPRA